jgi:ribosomal protein L39E
MEIIKNITINNKIKLDKIMKFNSSIPIIISMENSTIKL